MTSMLDERDLMDVIKKPIVTEKATRLMELNQFTFDVSPKATKPMIRAAIESFFNVKVVAVNTLHPPRKKRRVGKYLGYKAHYKRAIVTLVDGEPIRKALFPEV